MVDGRDGATPRQQLDRLFSLFSNSRRRVVLYALRDDGKATVGELVDAILAVEGDSQPTERERERVVVSLLHNHLPKLVDAGAVEHHPETGTVVRSDGIDRLDPFLSALATEVTPAESNLALVEELVVS